MVNFVRFKRQIYALKFKIEKNYFQTIRFALVTKHNRVDGAKKKFEVGKKN